MSKPSRDENRWRELEPLAAGVPADAVGVLGVLALANLVLLLPTAIPPAVRAVVGVPLLFWLPGYGLVSALFPRGANADGERDWGLVGDGEGATVGGAGIGSRERTALSFGASVAVLPILAIALSLVGMNYGVGVVVPSLTGLTVVGLVVGVVRRTRLPPRERYRLPYRRWVDGVNGALFRRRSTLDAVLDIALVVVVVASLAGVGYAVVTPTDGAEFTGMSVMTENETGHLTASGYPETLGLSGSELVVTVENHEDSTTTYTVVGELQQARVSGTSVEVVRREEVLRDSATLADGERWRNAHAIQPVLGGDDLRLIYYAYEGDAPPDPSTETAVEYVSIWVDAPTDG